MARRKKKDEYNISDIIKGSTKAGVNHAKIGGNSKPKVTHVDLQKNIKQGAKNTQNHHVTRTDIRNSSSHYDRSVTGNTFRTNRGINRIGNATSGLTKDWLSGKMLTGSQMHSNVNAGRIRRENYNRYRDQRGSNDRRFVNTTSRQENRIKTDIVQNKNKIKSEIKSTQKAADIGSARTEKQAFSLQKSAQKDLNKSKKGAGKVGSFAIDAYTNAMEMGLDLLAGGGATAMPSLASRSYGTAYMQAINDQKNTNGSNVTKQMKSNAAKYALGESALQAGTEKMFAPFKPLTKMSGKGVFGSLGESIEKKTLNTNAVKGLISKGMSEKTAGRIVKGLVGTTEEGLEEVAADIPEPLLQSKTYDKDAKKQYKQGSYYAGMARDFALGAGTAALLGGANAAIEGGNKLAKSGNSFSKGTKNSILESAKKSSNEEVKTQLNAITSNKEATDKDYRNLANSMTLEEATKQPEDSEAYQRATQIQKQKSKGYKITDDDYSDLANKVYSSKKQISERQDNAIREATAQLAGDTSKMNRAAKVTTSDAPVVMNLTASAVNEESENAEAVLRSIMPDVDTANSPQLAELPDAIGRIQVGTATVQDYSTIMGSNEGKALFTAVSGQNLPATNSGAVNILTQYTARQRVMNSPQIIMQAKNIVKNNAMNAMTQGLTENESKAYMAGLDNLDTDQIDNYNEAFLKYFNGGFVKGRSGNKENGFSMDTISKNISPEIRKSIGEVNAKTFYEAGINRGTEQTQNAEKSSSKVKKSAEAKTGSLKASNLSKRRLGEEAISYIESIASITGTNIEIKETTKDSKNINGYFKGNDTIVLYDGSDNPFGQVIKHELTHYIKKHAPKEYEAYQSFIIDNYYKYSPDALSKRVNGLISLYNQNGVKLTYEDALEELCADATDVFFKDSDMIDRICRENRTLAEKIYDGIKSLLTALKKLGRESKTNYGGFLKTVDALEEAERLWTKALVATAGTEVDDGGKEYAYKNTANNKKLAAVTYDAKGNVVPLSKRFNENSDDIRYSISAKDSQGNKLSSEQREFFKDSKAVDKDGNLAVVYHGTAKGDFTTFDPKFSDDGISIFMSDNKGIALSYAGSSDPISESNKGRGIYSCYLNLKNPMTVDCRGANWNKILDPDYDSVLFEYKDTKDGKRNYLVSDNGGNGKLLSEDEIESKYGDKVSEELHHEELTNKSFKRMNKTITVYTKGGNVFYPKWNDDAPIMKTRDICKRAYDNGNDGVIFSNVYDTGKYSSGTSKSTIYAAFSPEQIKNTDNTKPTGSDDIRFSISNNGTARLTDARIKQMMNTYGTEFEDSTYSKAYVAWMSPDEFLSLTTNNLSRIEKESKKLDRKELADETQSIHLSYWPEDKGEVGGHEGRHRMVALRNEGVKKVPVVIEYHDESTKSNRKPIKSMHLTGQYFNGNKAKGDVTVKDLVPISQKYKAEIKRKFGINGSENVKYSISKNPVKGLEGLATIELSDNQFNHDIFLSGQRAEAGNDYIYEFLTATKINPNMPKDINKDGRNWTEYVKEFTNDNDEYGGPVFNDYYYQVVGGGDGAYATLYAGCDPKQAREAFDKYAKTEKLEAVKDGETSDRAQYDIQATAEGQMSFKFSMPAKDSEGNTLTDAQKSYFANTKAVDEKGNLAVVYHGTNNGGFTVFNRTNNYYTDNASVADSYTKNNGIYKGYVNIKNPLVVDAKGNKFSGIPIENIDLDNIQKYAKEYGMSEFIENGKLRTSTADIVGLIEDLNDELNMGYDGVIFRNIYDEGLFGDNNNNKSNVYVTFNGNQFKNTTNINPTDNEDIRYSISEKDSTGETLTEDQRKYFAQSKAVDRQGNLEVLYHGTSEGGFTVFDPMMSDDETSLFFTDDEDVAATYSDSWDLYDSTEDNEGEAMNYPVYLNLKNPLIMNGNGYASWENIAIKGFERLIFESEDGEDYSILSSNTGEEYDDKKTIERKFGKDTLKVIEEKNNGVLLLKDGKLVEDESMDAGNVSVYDGKMVAGTTRYWAKYAKEHGYDGVIFNNIADEGLYGDGITYRTSNIYIAFNSNQVKDVANEHPTENEDIRYQFSNKAPGNNPALAVERKRNKRMEKEISRLKSEFKRSKNVTPDEKDTNRSISQLVKSWDAKMSSTIHAKVKNDVTAIYRELNQKNPGWSSIQEFSYDAADLIIDESEILKNSEAYELRKSLINYLRNDVKTIRVSEGHDNTFGEGFNAMRKSFFRIVNLSHDKGNTIDQYWGELQELYPGIFTDDIWNEGDMLTAIKEVLDNGKPSYGGIEGSEYGLSDSELEEEVAKEVLDMCFGLKQNKTFADKKAEEKKAALARQKKRMDDRYDKMKVKYKERLDKKDREYKDKIKDVRSKYKDKKDRKYYTERIKSYANWMSGRLLQPTEGKYIPEGYRKAVARLLSSFDFETDRTNKNAEKNGLSKRMIHVIDLITQYQNIMDNDESMMQVSDDFQDKLNKLAVLENKRVVDLTTEELADVYHVVKDIATHLSNMNKAFADGVKEQISELGDAVIAESRDIKDRSNASGIIPAGIDFITTSNNNPIDEFVCIGGTMEKLYMNIRKGFDKYIHNAEKIKEFTSTLQNEYKDIKNWSGDRAKAKTFKMQDGKTIQLTTAQVMSLYCLSKRPQALTHLMGSGIVSASVLNIKGKAGGRAFKSLYASRTSESRVMPTTMDINNILKGLTPDQIKVADYLQDYMVRVSAKLGNETSKKLYDIKKFNDPNYFPIKSSDKYLEEKFDNKQPSKIKNVGFTKETVKNASNPIVIDDIFNVFTNHTSTMAQYNALVPALTDFERVFNYKQRDKNGKTIASVRERLDAAYGRKTTDYITKFINDVNKNYNRDSDHELFNKVFANTKKGTLGFSLRVAIQQPTAIFRAGAVINPKYLMDVRNTAINLKEMREHSPIALWKSWGFYNTDVSSKMSDIFMNRRNAGDKLFMGIYGTLDDITWGYIWNATKAEIKQTRPELEKGSKAYWNAVSDRFSYIVDRTQVVDSVFHRSQIMRKTDMFSKLITAYMAEPTKTYNMLKTELTLASKDIKAGNKADATKRISRVTSVFFANAIAVSVAAALIDVLRSTLWDDDDNDDKDFLERWLKYSEQNTLQNINPLSFIPGLRDVQSIFQGYDANRADLEVIIQLKTAIDTWSSDTASTFKKIKVTAKAISLATGIPVSNIIREGESAYFEAVSAISGSPTKAKYMMHKLEYNYKSDTGESKLVKDYKTALKQGDTTAIKYIKKDLTDNVGVKPERLSNVVKNIYSDRLKAAIATYDADKVLKLIATEKAHGADTSKMLDTIVYKTTEDYKKTYDLENDDPKTRTKIDNFLRGIGYSKSYVKARKERYDRGWARYQVYMVYKHYGYNKAYAEAAYYCRKYPGIYKDARSMMYGQKRLGDSTKADYLKGKWEAK